MRTRRTAYAIVQRLRARILLVQLEFLTWSRARPLAYCTAFGVEEGLTANGCHCTVLPAIHEIPPDDDGSWLPHARRLFPGERFDQVWVWLPHIALDQAILEWISDIAPVRVGLLVESARYSAQEYAQFPWLIGREALIHGYAKHLTHIAVIDERDQETCEAWGVQATHWPAAGPAHSLEEDPGAPADPRAAFVGRLYGDRASLLADASMRGLLVHAPPAEDGTDIPEAFDRLNSRVVERLRRGGASADLLAEHVAGLHSLRNRALDCFIRRMRTYGAAVALPTLVKAYSPRVVEAMAAGRPVIAWEVPDRPLNRELFEDGEEILLYRDASDLSRHLQAVACDRPLCDAVVARARSKVRALHTVEKRAADLLRWIG